jgi:Rieske Fe-S protein
LPTADAITSCNLVHTRFMRVRVMLVLAVVLVAIVATATFLAMWRGGPSHPSGPAANVGDLRVGSATAIAVTLPDRRHTRARVFVARTAPRKVQAYLGVSTHLGCRLLLPGDGGYGRGFTKTSRRFFFEDPCGGSLYSLGGDCTGGPCPRGLDRYAVEVDDGIARIDVGKLITGPARGA